MRRGTGIELTADQLLAIQGAATPSAANVFATMNDLPPDELTSDELAAINGAASPDATNVFATMDDLPAITKTDYVISDEKDTSSALPANTATKQYYIVETGGNGADAGDILYDNGTGTGNCTIIEPAYDYRITIKKSLAEIIMVEGDVYHYDGSDWQLITSSVPVGIPQMIAKNEVPVGMLEMDGSDLSTSTYSRLYEKLGTTWGSGSGTFKLPNMAGKFPRGYDGTGAVDKNTGTGTRTFATNQPADLGKRCWVVGTTYDIVTGVGTKVDFLPNSHADSRPNNETFLFCIRF